MRSLILFLFLGILPGCHSETHTPVAPADVVWGRWSTAFYPRGDGVGLYKETWQFFPDGKVTYYWEFRLAERPEDPVSGYRYEGRYTIAPYHSRSHHQVRVVTIRKNKEESIKYHAEGRWEDMTGLNSDDKFEEKNLNGKNLVRVEGNKLYSSPTPHWDRSRFPEEPIDVNLEHPYLKQ